MDARNVGYTCSRREISSSRSGGKRKDSSDSKELDVNSRMSYLNSRADSNTNESWDIRGRQQQQGHQKRNKWIINKSIGLQATAGRRRAGTMATAGTPETLESLEAEGTSTTEGTSRALGMAAKAEILDSARIPKTSTAVGPTAAQERTGTSGNADNSRTPELEETPVEGMLTLVGTPIHSRGAMLIKAETIKTAVT
jgi:hypothetical protein